MIIQPPSVRLTLKALNSAGTVSYEMPCVAYTNYYAEALTKESLKLLKVGYEPEVARIGRALSQFVAKRDVLIPMPGRNGHPSTTWKLAAEAALLSGCKVYPTLLGRLRPSWCETKKIGRTLSAEDFGFTFNASVIHSGASRVILLDDVLATGTTARFAARALLDAGVRPELLVYAVDQSAIV